MAEPLEAKVDRHSAMYDGLSTEYQKQQLEFVAKQLADLAAKNKIPYSVPEGSVEKRVAHLMKGVYGKLPEDVKAKQLAAANNNLETLALRYEKERAAQKSENNVVDFPKKPEAQAKTEGGGYGKVAGYSVGAVGLGAIAYLFL